MIELKTVLKQYPDCLSNRTTFRSILMDCYPSERRTINILINLFECGMANKIKTMNNISAVEMQRLITQAENEFGISAQHAQEAILLWAAAYDVTASSVKVQIPNGTPTQFASQDIQYVEGNVSDYIVQARKDGYYITRFCGFEEEVMTIPSIIGDKVIQGIGEDVFKGCTTLKTVYISDGIEVIENRAFEDCRNMENIVLPNTLRQIGNVKDQLICGLNDIGKGSKELFSRNLLMLWGMTAALMSHVFYNCKRLRRIHIPNGTEKICSGAFDGRYLTDVYIPPSVTTIQQDAFGYELSNLTIHCEAGSAAVEFARNNKIDYEKAQF